MRELEASEINSVSGGTNIFSMYAMPPGTTSYIEGSYDPLNTGNSWTNFYNMIALAGTGEISAAAVEAMLGGTVCDEVRDAYHAQNPDPQEDIGAFIWDSIKDSAASAAGTQYEQWEADTTAAYIACLEGIVYGVNP